MFSSPLTYTRRQSSDRYTQPLPPPLPASPLRHPPQPGLQHALTAPAAVIPSHLPASEPSYAAALVDSPGIETGTEDADLSEAIRRSLTVPSDAGGMWADLRALHEAQELDRAVHASITDPSTGGETEAERMVRMMSRRGRDTSRGGYGVGGPSRMNAAWDASTAGAFATDQDPGQVTQGQWSAGYHQEYQAPENLTYQHDPAPGQADPRYDPPYPHHEKYSWPAPLPKSPEMQEYPLMQHAAPMPPPHKSDFPTYAAPPSQQRHNNNSSSASSKPAYIPSLTPLASALPSGATTPCPPYDSQPETAYLDAIPFERQSGGTMRMPAAEDYASIPGYGVCDSDEEDEEEDVPVVAPAEVGRSGTVVSRSSYTVGDEASLMRVSEAVQEHKPADEGEEGIRGEAGPTIGTETVSGKAEGTVKEKRTLVFSYHPLPAAAEPAPPIPAKSTLPPQIRLYSQPTSFQLLSTSLKRLFADLMISADSLFVPSPSAYAESSEERPEWRVEVWVRTFALPVAPNRRVVGGGFRTMIGLEMEEVKARPVAVGRTSSASLALTRTRSSVGERQEAPVVPSLPRKPIATTSDSENALVPSFATSYVLRLRLTQPLHVPFSAAQLVETLHRHYKYGKRIARSSTASVAAGTVEENAYSFAKMVDRAPGPVDEVARLSKAHKLGKIQGGVVPLEENQDGIQGQAGRKGFRYTVRKAVSKAVGAVQSEREETAEDDRANWVTPFTG